MPLHDRDGFQKRRDRFLSTCFSRELDLAETSSFFSGTRFSFFPHVGATVFLILWSDEAFSLPLAASLVPCAPSFFLFIDDSGERQFG